MPDINLKFYVDFTTWDTLTNPQKSLITFLEVSYNIGASGIPNGWQRLPIS